MAIYEYECQDCGMSFEARRAMKDADAPIACPDCGKFHAKRGLSMFFAGTGGRGGSATMSESSGSGGCGSCGGGSCASCGGH